MSERKVGDKKVINVEVFNEGRYININEVGSSSFDSGYMHGALKDLTGLKLKVGEGLQIEITTKIIKNSLPKRTYFS